jgi:hypothetical protein
VAVTVPLTATGDVLAQELVDTQDKVPILTFLMLVAQQHLWAPVLAQRAATSQAPSVHQPAVAWDY